MSHGVRINPDSFYVAGNTPLRREGHPDEVAASVAYLLSEDASFLNGVNLDINGGLFFS